MTTAHALLHSLCQLTDDLISQQYSRLLRNGSFELDLLNVDWLEQVNEEARNLYVTQKNSRIHWPDEILQFDYCGESWISETAFTVYRGIGSNLKMHLTLMLLYHIKQGSVAALALIKKQSSSPSILHMLPIGVAETRQIAD